ncbi:MAG: hypothetical protein ACJAZS_000688 [Alteromonas naphthalenivorans]|jgi:hypothetical protein
MKYITTTFLLLSLITQHAQARIPSNGNSKNKKVISISVEDEIKALLTDEQKYKKSKHAWAGFTCIGIVTSFLIGGIYKEAGPAIYPATIAVLGAPLAAWNYWSECHAREHAHELAHEHGYTIGKHDDSELLERMSQGTQTD